MNNFKTVLKVITPSIICVILILTTKMGLDYYPLSFGLVVGIFNWNNYNDKLGSYIGLIIGLVASYASFFIAAFSITVINELITGLGLSNKEIIGMYVAIGIISPLLVFLGYKFIFNYKLKTNFSKLVITSSIILLLIIIFIHHKYFDNKEINQEFSEILNIYTLWQIIMALGLQLIIYQKDLIKSKAL